MKREPLLEADFRRLILNRKKSARWAEGFKEACAATTLHTQYGRLDSNQRPRASKARILPTELLPESRCVVRDSNPDALRRWFLRPVCLPIPSTTRNTQPRCCRGSRGRRCRNTKFTLQVYHFSKTPTHRYTGTLPFTPTPGRLAGEVFPCGAGMGRKDALIVGARGRCDGVAGVGAWLGVLPGWRGAGLLEWPRARGV